MSRFQFSKKQTPYSPQPQLKIVRPAQQQRPLPQLAQVELFQHLWHPKPHRIINVGPILQEQFIDERENNFKMHFDGFI